MRVPVFHESVFPNAATHCKQSECGYSLYRGVLVQWDEDHDERILDVLDEMPASVLDRLLIVQEHEGCFSGVWQEIPEGYEFGEEIVTPDGDRWSICSSLTPD